MSKTSHKSIAVASFHKKYEETTTPNRPNPITIITRFIFQGTDGPKPATSTAGLSRTGSGGPAKARRKASETSDWLKPFWKRKSSLSLVGWSVCIWIQEIKWTHVYIYIYILLVWKSGQMTQVIMNYLTIFTKAYVSSQSRGKLKFLPPTPRQWWDVHAYAMPWYSNPTFEASVIGQEIHSCCHLIFSKRHGEKGCCDLVVKATPMRMNYMTCWKDLK